MWRTRLTGLPVALMLAACAATPQTRDMGEGRHEILIQAPTPAEVETQIAAGARKACPGGYRVVERMQAVTVCADTPLDKCPRNGWNVIVRCGEV